MKRTSVLAAILTVVLCFSGIVSAETYGGGDGSPETPFLILTPQQMNLIGANPDDWSKCFKLMADIDMSIYTGTQYNIIGNSTTRFTGTFDGNNKIISYLTITAPTQNFVGLFGYVDSGGQIRNLGVENVNITGRDDIGGLVGFNQVSCTLTSCYATGSVAGETRIGGLVGWNSGTLTSCYATGSVSGEGYVGGLVGWCNGSTLTSCYATGSVSGGSNSGGLVGYNNENTIITFCYATGSVTGTGNLGGLVGRNGGIALTSCYATGSVSGTSSNVGGLVGENHHTLTSCYATGTVSGSSGVGGLVGWNDSILTSCYWDIQTSGQTTSQGGMGMGTAAMQNPETYLRSFWDFKGEVANGTMDVWVMPTGGGYPVFVWQLEDSPVSNDEMSNAIAVMASSTISSSSIGATGLDITRNSYKDSSDVWYYFDCASTGKYTITVHPNGFNSTLGVFDAEQYEIVFNDDFFGEKSVVTLNAVAGRRYYIRVAGYDGQTGNFMLTIAQGAIKAIQGDLNYDGMVNLVDFSIFADNWLVDSNAPVSIVKIELNSDPNWTTEGQWAYGTPMGSGGISHGFSDPTSGYTGSNVCGVNLDGDYTIAVGGPYTLTAGPFDCTQFNDIKLRFARWLNTDEPDYVVCKVDVSNNGTNWNTLWENTAAVTDNSWQAVEYNVSATADNQSTVYFRWSYEILDGRAYPYSGWNIDDVELLGKL